MKIDVPYNLLILSAFANLLKYEDRYELEIEKLNAYLEALLAEVLGEYEEESVTFNAPIDKWQGKVEFIKNNNYLEIFLQKYHNFFRLDNDKIKVSLTLDYEDIYQLMNQEQKKKKISNRFLCPSESLLLLQKLGTTKIINQVKSLINLERKIEELYYQEDDVTDEIVAKYSLLRILFFNSLGQMDDNKLNAYLNVGAQIMETDEDNMDFMPVDADIFASSPYYNMFSEEQLGNYLNKAIFGKFPLYLEKSLLMLEDTINYHLLRIVEASEIEEEVMEATSLLEGDELKFSFTYLAKLRQFIDSYGEIKELVNIEKRLLYILDNPNMELFDKELVLDYIDFYEEEKIDELGNVSNYAFEVYLQCEEIFLSNLSFDNIKKVLFIATYYELTHDKKIEQLIDKHYLDTKYDSFCQIIFGDIRSSFLNLEDMR